MATNRKPDKDDEEKRRQEQMQRSMRYGITYLIMGFLVLWLFQQFILGPLTIQAIEIPYSEFKQKLAAGDIKTALISETDIRGEMVMPAETAQPEAGATGAPTPLPEGASVGATPGTVRYDTVVQSGSDPTLIEELERAGVQYRFQRPPSPAGAFLLSWLLPLGLLGVFWYFLFRARAKA